MSNVMMKAASGVQSQILKDGSVIAVDANGFLAVPQDCVTDCLRAGHSLVSAMSALPAVQYKTRATTTTGAIDLAVGEVFGGSDMTAFHHTGGTTPGTSSFPTAAALALVATNMAIGDSYVFRYLNSCSGTIPAFAASAGITFTGTMTVATNTFRDYMVIRTAAATFTVQEMGIGTEG